MASFRINMASAYMNEVPDEENSRSVGPMAPTISKPKHFHINKRNNVALRAREIGIGFSGFGIFFILLGGVLLFDHGFLAIGNLLFVSGVILTMGQKSSLEFFMKRQKFKGTLVFVLGFSLLLIGFPIIGTAIESYEILGRVSHSLHNDCLVLDGLCGSRASLRFLLDTARGGFQYDLSQMIVFCGFGN